MLCRDAYGGESAIDKYSSTARSGSAVGGEREEEGMPRKRYIRDSGKGLPESEKRVQEVTPVRKSRPYQARNVKDVQIADLTGSRDGMGCVVGMDTSKREVLACLRWNNGSFERPWRVKLTELPLFMGKLSELRAEREVVVALEPTGTYCDPVRQALRDAGFKVYRVSPKATHDYAEIFDGVPSQHDGKDAACVAELAALKKGGEWEWDLDDQSLRYEVDWMDAQQKSLTRWLGRVEGLLGRHWPEVTSILKLSSSTLLQMLVHYGGPGGLSQDAEAVDRLKKWGANKLDEKKIQQVLDSAKTTMGVCQNPADVQQMRRIAGEALRIRKELNGSKRKVADLVKGHPKMKRLGEVVGYGTAAVCWVYLGDPSNFHSGGAYLKAVGLNLKERSSGFFKGQLKITKRGPSSPRRWLYFAAMRYSQKPWIRPWYQFKKDQPPGSAKSVLVILMRKLVLALHQVSKGSTFDERTLLPGASKYHPRAASTQQQRKERNDA